MNASSDGSGGPTSSGCRCRGGVDGGVKGMPLDVGVRSGSPHRITSEACLARWWIMCLRTGCITNSSSAALFWALRYVLSMVRIGSRLSKIEIIQKSK